MQKSIWRSDKIATKKVREAYIFLFKFYPILCNVYISALCIEWWFGIDKISNYIYPLIGDSYYVIAIMLLGSFVHGFCGIFRYYLANMALWLTFEVLYVNNIIVPQFLITMSLTTLFLFVFTIIIHLIAWKKETIKTTARV